MTKKNYQKGGANLYGPTIESMKLQGELGAGKSRVPHSPLNTTCGAGSATRPTALPFVGGGLAHSTFNGSGHRPILANPGFGYKTGENNVLFKGSRPTTSSYSASSCQDGGKKKRKSKKKKMKKRKKSRKGTKRKGTKRKRTKRKGTKRKGTKRKRTKRKSRKRNKLIGCGQKGGSNVQYGFPGPIDKTLGDLRLWKGNGITVKNNFNCPDTYNHFTK